MALQAKMMEEKMKKTGAKPTTIKPKQGLIKKATDVNIYQFYFSF